MSHLILPAVGAERGTRNAIELGWLLMGQLEAVDREAVTHARDQMLARMSEDFPDLVWKMPMVERNNMLQAVREQPAALLEAGRRERDARRWDFVIVITGADLVSYYEPIALSASSRAMGVAVMSTMRIDPLAEDCPLTEHWPLVANGRGYGSRREIMSRRLYILALHVFGHLNGLTHDDDPASAMRPCRTVADVDGACGYSARARARIAERLPHVADLRLEERPGRHGGLAFYARAAWRRRGDIVSSIRHAAPWQFPLLLGRLTTAALSAIVVLIITGDPWKVALVQSAATIVALSALALSATTWYVARLQGLLPEPTGTGLTEQFVVTRLSAILTVAIGMATTYALLFTIVTVMGRLVLPPELVAGWSGTSADAVTMADYLRVAGFLSTLGIVVGALGASFENQDYMRHVTSVDDEA